MAYRSRDEVGREIARLREEQGLSQTELGAAVQLDQTAMSKVETGKRGLAVSELMAIADRLAVPAESILQADDAVLAWRAEGNEQAMAEAQKLVEEVISDFFAFEAAAR